MRTLRQKVQSMLCERTAISRRLEELARQELEALQEEDRMTPSWTSWGSQTTCSERDLEAAILRELERFLLVPCTDFSFIARQKRPAERLACDESGDQNMFSDHSGHRRTAKLERNLRTPRSAHPSAYTSYAPFSPDPGYGSQ